MTNTFGRIACRCAVVMVVVSKLALLVLVVVLGGNVRASATMVSYTGAELLSLPEVFFPTRPPAVQGDSLSFEAGDQRYEILLRWELLEPGSLSLSGGSVRVEVLADLTRQSADWEAFITLWDGTKAIGGGLYNNDGGGVQKWVATSDGVHGTERVPHDIESLGSLFSIGQSGQFALEFELTKSSSQVSASGAGASIQYSTSALDLSQGLGVLVFMQDEWEQLDVNSIRVTAIPGLCIFGGDTSCNTDDLDALYEVFNTQVPPTDSLFDLNSDTVVDTADLDRWLNLAPTENGYGSPYLRGDTELDRDVDITTI